MVMLLLRECSKASKCELISCKLANPVRAPVCLSYTRSSFTYTSSMRITTHFWTPEKLRQAVDPHHQRILHLIDVMSVVTQRRVVRAESDNHYHKHFHMLHFISGGGRGTISP